jgi:Ca2+-dependent lipid-binding protein
MLSMVFQFQIQMVNSDTVTGYQSQTEHQMLANDIESVTFLKVLLEQCYTVIEVLWCNFNNYKKW